MADMKAVTCCFTGHRNIPASSEQAVMARTEEIVRTLIAVGVIYFNVGGAVGYDTLVAQLLFRLRDTEFPQIKVILVYPYDGYTSGWNEKQRETYARILPLYDEVVCAAQSASREAFLARDRRMVDNSSYCISYCTRRSGGTAYTVRYAKKCGVPVFSTAPST